MSKKTFIEYLKTIPYNRWNFTILKQLAEEEEIDFSEELVSYLKETPWNTNWNMLANWGIKPSDSEGDIKRTVVYEDTIVTTNQYQRNYVSINFQTFLPEHIYVTYDGVEYSCDVVEAGENSDTIYYGGVGTYSGAIAPQPNQDYPFTISYSETDSEIKNIFTYTPGEHTIKIEIDQEEK